MHPLTGSSLSCSPRAGPLLGADYSVSHGMAEVIEPHKWIVVTELMLVRRGFAAFVTLQGGFSRQLGLPWPNLVAVLAELVYRRVLERGMSIQ